MRGKGRSAFSFATFLERFRSTFLENLSLSKIAWGLFDALLLGLTLVDAVSDAMVAFEFYENDHLVYFYAVLVCFALGSISDTVGFLVSLENRWRLSTAWEWVFYVTVFLPFAQLLPIVQYFMSIFDPGFEDFAKHDSVDWQAALAENEREGNAAHGEETASSQLFKEAAEKQRALAEVDRAVSSRQAAFLCLNIQALVESAPACVIHAVAASRLGGMTTLQAVSLSLSLFNIVIKAFQLCRSYEISIFAAKGCIIAFDVFSFAFVVSTVVASNQPAEASFCGLEVSSLAWAWLTWKAINVCVIASCACLLAVREIYNESNWNEKFRVSGIFLAMFCLAPIPIAIAQEAARLSWAIALNLGVSPGRDGIPKMPLLHSFLTGSDNSSNSNNSGNNGDIKFLRDTTDWPATFDALERSFDKAIDDADNDIKQENQHRVAYAQQQSQRAQYNRQQQQQQQQQQNRGKKNRPGPTPPAPAAVAPAPLPAPPPLSAPPTRWGSIHACFKNKHWAKSADRIFRELQRPHSVPVYVHDTFAARARYCILLAAFLRATRVMDSYYGAVSKAGMQQNCKNQMRTIRNDVYQLMEARKFSYLDLLVFFFLPRWHPDRPAERARQRLGQTTSSSDVKWLEAITITSVIFFTVTTALFGVLFPFLHLLFYGLNDPFLYASPIALVTLLPTLASFAGVVLLARKLFEYHMVCSVFQNGMNYGQQQKDVSSIVDSFYSLPLRSLCTSGAIADEAVPRDAVYDHVLPFLDQKMVKLYGVVTSKFDEMSAGVQDEEVFYQHETIQ